MRKPETISPVLRDLVGQVLNQGLEAGNDEISGVISETLLTRRLKRLIRIADFRYLDGSLISNCEYQLFLDQLRREGQFLSPDHWFVVRHRKGRARDPVVGVRSEDAKAFCIWLTEREEGPWIYRLPGPDEGTEIRSQGDQPIGYWTTSDASENPGFIGIGDAGAREPLQIEQVDFAFAQVRDLDLALGHALDRDLALDQARAQALDLALDRAHQPELDDSHDLARALDQGP